MTRPMHRGRVFAGVVFLILAGVFVTMSAIDRRQNGDVPPLPADAQDVDNVALQLLHGRGFTIDRGDREWRQPYEAANGDGTFDAALSAPRLKSPARLAPLPPLLAAAMYGAFGRSFAALQLFNALVTAAGYALVCLVVRRAFGERVALIMAAFLLVSQTYAWYVVYRSVPIETLAVLLVALLTLVFPRFVVSPGFSSAIACGVIAGFLVLVRDTFALWIPAIALLMLSLPNGLPRQRLLALTAAFVAVALAIAAPWWIASGHIANARLVSDGSFREGGPYAPLLLAAVAAPFVAWRRRASIDGVVAILFFALIAVDLCSMFVTKSLEWRSFVPIEPLIAACAALAVAAPFFGDDAIARISDRPDRRETPA